MIKFTGYNLVKIVCDSCRSWMELDTSQLPDENYDQQAKDFAATTATNVGWSVINKHLCEKCRD